MSNAAIRWAWSIETRSRGSKCTLVCLADHANKAGQCWPSQKRMAEMTGASVDTIQRDLREFVDSGLIAIELRNSGSGRRSSVYTLLMPGVVSASSPNRSLAVSAKPQIGLAQTAKSVPQTAIVRLGNKNPHLEPLKREAPSAPSLSPKDCNLRSGKLSRIASDWKPDDLDLAYAREQGLDEEQIAYVTASFHDYYLKAPDDKGESNNWQASWRTWVRREIVDIRKGAENVPRAQSAAKPAKIKLLFFPIESPEFAAWKQYMIATTGRGPFITERESDRKRGSWFERPEPPPLLESKAA